MTINPLNFKVADSSWHNYLKEALNEIDASYLNCLTQSSTWLPGADKIFNAFSLPLDDVNYVLFGESPYPRRESANGYAFWDAAVNELWSTTGLSKPVNRATSLRNLIKMLLIAEGALNKSHSSQSDILKIDKTNYVRTNQELFNNFLKHGFLLLNTTLALHPTGYSPQQAAKFWVPFMEKLLNKVIQKKPHTKFILLGSIANKINKLLPIAVKKIYAPHPYNISFLENENMLTFFKPLYLLRK